MNFSEMGIPPDSELIFRDGEKIIYDNEIISLTQATRKILELDHNVQPSPHWTFVGKLLKDIYDETYGDEDE